MYEIKEVIKLIEQDGWKQARQKGSHRSYNHNTKTGIVTIAYHRLSDEVPKGTQDQKEEAKYTELFEWTSIEDKIEKKKIN